MGCSLSSGGLLLLLRVDVIRVGVGCWDGNRITTKVYDGLLQ